MTRAHAKPARLQIHLRQRHSVVAQAAANCLPRLGFKRICHPWNHIDLHIRGDGEAIVGAVVLEARNGVAKSVDVFADDLRRWIQNERMAETTLENEVPRLQVQKMMRMRDLAAVLIDRRVTHGVARHADTARKSKSICEKCCDVRWSDSCAAADIRFLRYSDRRRRDSGAASSSPPRLAYLSSSSFETAS